MSEWETRSRIEEIFVLQQKTLERINRMAASQQDLDAAISSLQSTVTTLETTTGTILTTLQQLQTGNGIDFTNEISQLTTIQNALSTLNTNENAALPTTTAPVTTEADVTGVAHNSVIK